MERRMVDTRTRFESMLEQTKRGREEQEQEQQQWRSGVGGGQGGAGAEEGRSSSAWEKETSFRAVCDLPGTSNDATRVGTGWSRCSDKSVVFDLEEDEDGGQEDTFDNDSTSGIVINK